MSAATSANENCTACANVILSAVNPGRCATSAEQLAMAAEEELLFHLYMTHALSDRRRYTLDAWRFKNRFRSFKMTS